MSSAISMFLRSAVNNDGIPFEIKRPVPNEETKAALDEYEEMKSDFVKYKRYSSFDEALDEVFQVNIADFVSAISNLTGF